MEAPAVPEAPPPTTDRSTRSGKCVLPRLSRRGSTIWPWFRGPETGLLHAVRLGVLIGGHQRASLRHLDLEEPPLAERIIVDHVVVVVHGFVDGGDGATDRRVEVGDRLG